MTSDRKFLRSLSENSKIDKYVEELGVRASDSLGNPSIFVAAAKKCFRRVPLHMMAEMFEQRHFS